MRLTPPGCLVLGSSVVRFPLVHAARGTLVGQSLVSGDHRVERESHRRSVAVVLGSAMSRCRDHHTAPASRIENGGFPLIRRVIPWVNTLSLDKHHDVLRNI